VLWNGPSAISDMAKRKLISAEFMALREYLKRLLEDPIIHSALPNGIRNDIAEALGMNVAAWTVKQDDAVQHAVRWSMSYL
jgi:hypothetical protein